MNIHRKLIFKSRIFTAKDLNRASNIFLILYGLAIGALANADYGILNWLANPREGYQLHRAGLGHWYGLAISSLACSFTLSFLAKPNPSSIIKSLVFYIFLSYLLGSKGIILSFFGATLIFLWFARWDKLFSFLLFFTPLIFIIMIWNLYLALQDDFEFNSIYEYFDYYKNAANYYTAIMNNKLELFHGQVALSSFWSYIPRWLYPEKPYIYGVLHVNEYFFPGLAELTHTPAFGGAVEQYADFGVIGVVFYGLFNTQAILNALLGYLIFKKPGFKLKHLTLPTIIVFIIYFSPSYGSFFPGLLYLFFTALSAYIIKLSYHQKKIYVQN